MIVFRTYRFWVNRIIRNTKQNDQCDSRRKVGMAWAFWRGNLWNSIRVWLEYLKYNLITNYPYQKLIKHRLFLLQLSCPSTNGNDANGHENGSDNSVTGGLALGDLKVCKLSILGLVIIYIYFLIRCIIGL